MKVDDRKLVKLCKSGNTEGFELLIKKYEKYIYTICYHYTSSREDALDLLQDIYVKLYKFVYKLDDERSVLPWVKKVTVNTCLNFMRDKKVMPVSISFDTDETGYGGESFIASSQNVEDEISFKDTKRLIEDLVGELPGEMRIAIILRHVERMSYDEIAKAMSCPVGTVKTHLFRGRKLLKDRLKAAGIWEV